jgi:hypothetical protein
MLIGIGHKARQGKDTVGEILTRKYKFKILHFADALKDEAKKWGWKPENKNESAFDVLNTIQSLQSVPPYKDSIYDKFYNMACDNHSMSFLQWLGGFRRAHDADYWVNGLINSLPHSYNDDYAICDMRYINELKAIKRRVGLVFDVRCYENGSRYIDPERDPYHPSETELDGIPHDFVLEASKGNVRSLEIQTDNIMKYMGY